MPSASELLQTAVTKTGLDDFGDDSFREGFEILVRALNEEGRLNARGENFVFARVPLHLRQRLQVEDWYRRHPEIDEEPIAAPVFGLGLPRTGSTALSFLLAQDPDIRYLHSWEAAEPCPPPSTVPGDDPRIPAGVVELWAGSRHHVPQDPNGPMECLDLMALDFTSTYGYERRVLKLLQWGQPTRWRTGHSPRCSRPGCATRGMASSRSACSNARSQRIS
jgi:hypothetical protein